MLDTAAETSVISLDLAERLKIIHNPVTHQISNSTGGIETAIGETEPVCVEVEGISVNVTFLVTNIQMVDVLLGLDWFEKSKIMVDPP